MDDFEKVTVNVKAIAVKDPTQIGDETEQDILIVDKTGTANVSLWEDNVQMNTVGTGPSPTWQGNTNYNFEI